MKTKWFVVVVAFAMAACQKTEELQPVTGNPTNTTTTPVAKPVTQFDISGQKLISQGGFVSNVHVTSGNVRLYEKSGKYTLVFTDFKTDAGPDLRIYLAEDKSASKFVEVSSKVNVGDYFIELPANADLKNQKFVLIWCKQFTVLFGNAQLG